MAIPCSLNPSNTVLWPMAIEPANETPTDRAPPNGRRAGLGLSSKLLFLTILFVMLAEVLIYVPSVANFH